MRHGDISFLVTVLYSKRAMCQKACASQFISGCLLIQFCLREKVLEDIGASFILAVA